MYIMMIGTALEIVKDLSVVAPRFNATDREVVLVGYQTPTRRTVPSFGVKATEAVPPAAEANPDCDTALPTMLIVSTVRLAIFAPVISASPILAVVMAASFILAVVIAAFAILADVIAASAMFASIMVAVAILALSIAASQQNAASCHSGISTSIQTRRWSEVGNSAIANSGFELGNQ